MARFFVSESDRTSPDIGPKSSECSATRGCSHRYAKSDVVPPLRAPSFFILGARKGGTTSLFAYLCEHPRVAEHSLDLGPMSGEVGYFGKDGNWHKGEKWCVAVV